MRSLPVPVLPLEQFLRQSLLVEAVPQDTLSDDDRQQALVQFAQ
jgi:hypothetical protein